MNTSIYQVLLYYKFVEIEDQVHVRDEQKRLCQQLHLQGRIIIAQEGINGTLEGVHENTEKYIHWMHGSRYFKDIRYKKSIGTGDAFPRLSIRIRPEIITSGISILDSVNIRGKYITPQQLHQWFCEKKEFYLVDMRNDYEYSSGYFEGFIPSGLKSFHDLGKILPRLQHLKDKIIVTVCTGGIRCEKASGFLLSQGFVQVYQLQDGIQTYMEMFPNEHFKGKLYVFDKRLTLGFNMQDTKHEVVGTCFHCGIACDRYVNCSYNFCHLHYICCPSCLDKQTGLAFCHLECKEKFFLFARKKRNIVYIQDNKE